VSEMLVVRGFGSNTILQFVKLRKTPAYYD